MAAVSVLAGLTLLARADAPAGRYTIANGTVYDTRTKLTWQQAVPSTTYTWANAKTYCAGLPLPGTGWRLPTAKELQTIVDESRSAPSIDTTAFPSTPSTWFWSSSPLAGSSLYAWYVDFFSGFTSVYDLSIAYRVRCVR
ncbi:MAG: DUF1566 domain-containing protein [Deltaproteobacteria bacterium]|nr:DUF1566 domain-containing protein [Deltaproteobacteria bacterium]